MYGDMGSDSNAILRRSLLRSGVSVCMFDSPKSRLVGKGMFAPKLAGDMFLGIQGIAA